MLYSSTKVSPHYQYGAQQALSILSVMDADALETSHSISVEVENPTQISEIFDSISYTKGRFPIYFKETNIDKVLKRIGAAVIRMMNDFLGESTFRKGVTNYLGQKCFTIPNHAHFKSITNMKFKYLENMEMPNRTNCGNS